MKKLLLLVFSLTLVLFFTSNAFAQQGVVKVANNNELIQALNDPSVESIEIIQEGFYDEIMMDAVPGTVISKGSDGSRSCTFSITRTNKCFISSTDKNFATAALSGADCPPQPTSGAYGWSSPTAGLTFVLADMADIYDYDAVFTTTAPGDYLIKYSWNAFDEAQANVFLFSTPEITVLTSSDDSVCGLTVDITFDYDMGALPSDTLVTWYVDGSPVTGYPTMPGTFTFTAPNCGDVELKLEVGNTQCGADDEILDLYFFSTPVVDAGDDDYTCGFVYEGLDGSASVGCGTIDSETWTAAAGNPGNATFNGDTVTVDACGAYDFIYTAASGDCEGADTVQVIFVDQPVVEAGDADSACGVILPPEVQDAGEFRGYGTLYGSYTADCEADSVNVNWSVFSGPAGASVTYVQENDTLVTDIVVNMCGTYKFLLTVWNGPIGSNCSGNDTVVRKFFDPPVVHAGNDTITCGLEMTFDPMYEVECDNGNAVTTQWLTAPGAPGNATFTGDDVEVDACGVYEFVYEVTNTLCIESDTIIVEFFDTPVVDAGIDQDICGIYVSPGEFLGLAELYGGYAASCTGGTFPTTKWTYTYEGPFAGGNVDYLDGDDADTTEIEVDSCGIYTFTLAAYSVVGTDTICTGYDTSIYKFYDMPEIEAGPEDTAVCGYDMVFDPSWSVVCDNGDPVTYSWITIVSPANGTATFVGDSVYVDECGTYQFIYAVTNTTCTAKDTVTVEFFEMPTDVDAGENDTLCGYTADLAGTYVSSCGVSDVKWSKVSGPGVVMFNPDDENNVTVTVDTCGPYVFKFEVTNGLCIDSAYVTVDFIGTATFVYDDAYPIPDSVCGYDTDPFYLGYFITCSLDDADGVWTTEAGASIAAAVQPTRGDTGGDNWIASAEECGTYWYTYTVTNGDCIVDTTINISFFESPDPVIDGPDTVYTCSTVEYCATVADTCNTLPLTDYTFTWTVAGGVFANDSTMATATCVDVTWDSEPYMPASRATIPMLTLHAEINGVDGCEGFDTMYIYKQLPTLEGQVKYWNTVETYMPSPYATDDYQTIPFDYFYVILYLDDMQALIPLDTAFVQPRLMEDLEELMSYFDFELNTEMYGCDAQYVMKVWDGGLLYHTTPPPPDEETKLGGSTYTYNNWGGVNATDALAIQLMVGGVNDINGAPWNYNWVGVNTLSPYYGYYSYRIADVNTSDLFGTTGITALDALTAKYRAVGLLGSYPHNGAGNNQFSPNFRVTGRMVDSLPEITFPMPFDSLNVPDVPFTHSGTDYMYFSYAIDHQYTSAPLPWEGAANYINLYYEAIGDVNASYVPPGSGLKAEPTVTLTYEGMFSAYVGEELTIPVNVDRDAEVGAITLSFNYRNDLIEVLGTNFGDDDMFINHEEGVLNMAWFSTDGVEYAADETVAQIKIRVLAEIPADVELFELNLNTELADVTANPIDVDLKTIGVSTDKGLNVTELVAGNYPNPFNNATTISYTLPESGSVKVDVYNNMGMLIATLVDEVQDSGVQEVVFNTGDTQAGVYFYHITVEGEMNTYSAVKRMIVVN